MSQAANTPELFDALKRAVSSIREEQLNKMIRQQQSQAGETTATNPLTSGNTTKETVEKTLENSLQIAKFFLDNLYKMRLEQSRKLYTAAIFSSITGASLFVIGTIVFSTTGSIYPLLGAGLAGICLAGISAIFHRLMRSNETSLAELFRERLILDKTSTAINYIDRLPTQQEKDEAIKDLITQILSLTTIQNAMKDSKAPTMSPEEEKVLSAFKNPKYNWQTVESIAKETGLPATDIIQMLESNNQIVRSTVPDKQGRLLYTTRNYYMSRENFVNHILSVLADQIK